MYLAPTFRPTLHVGNILTEARWLGQREHWKKADLVHRSHGTIECYFYTWIQLSNWPSLWLTKRASYISGWEANYERRNKMPLAFTHFSQMYQMTNGFFSSWLSFYKKHQRKATERERKRVKSKCKTQNKCSEITYDVENENIQNFYPQLKEGERNKRGRQMQKLHNTSSVPEVWKYSELFHECFCVSFRSQQKEGLKHWALHLVLSTSPSEAEMRGPKTKTSRG